MKKSTQIFVALLILLFASNLEAALKIEQDLTFKQMLIDLKTNQSQFYVSKYGELFYLPQEVRADLMFYDLIDQVSLVLEKDQFAIYKKELNLISSNTPLVNFLTWFDKLRFYAEADPDFEKALDNKLVIINYTKSGSAISFPIKIFTADRSKLIRKNKLIDEYNEYAYDAEAPFLLRNMHLSIAPFIHNTLTATKFKKIRHNDKKMLNQIRIAYYKAYCRLIKNYDQTYQAKHNLDFNFDYNCHPRMQKALTIKAPLKASKKLRTESLVLFNALQTLPDKHQILELINQEIPLIQVGGQLLLVPSELHQNINQIQEIIHDNTYRQLLSHEDDEMILALRHWIKDNYFEVDRARKLYNLDHPNNMIELSFKHVGNRIPRRAEIFNNYQKLITILPDEPWNETLKATMLSKRGRHVVLGKNWLGRLGFAMGRTMKKVIAPENVISTAAGVAILMTTGSLPVASASRVLLHDSVNAIVHDKGFIESFKNTPKDLALSIVTSAGFTGGHLMKLIAIDATEAGIRSRLTGQDFATSLLVGGISGALRGVLPTDLARPMIHLTQNSVIDKDYIIKATMLEVATRTLNQSIQGAAVAMLTDETPLKGAIKGAAFGAGFTGFYTSMFGVRYDVIGLYGRENLENSLQLELEYNELVNTFGVVDSSGNAEMGMELFEDTDWRVGGLWSKVQPSASFSGFGFIHSPGPHVKNYLQKQNGSISVMTHEVGVHDLQKEYNGIFNFLIDYSKEAWVNGTGGNHDNAFLLREAYPDLTFNKFEQYRVGGKSLPPGVSDVSTVTIYETGNTVYYLIIEDLATHSLQDGISVPYWAK